jgi:hypothetical protein
MEHKPTDATAKAAAFANGLRKTLAVAGGRWGQWPGGKDDLAQVLACIDGIQSRLLRSRDADDAETVTAACVADLRAVLEWTTYQSACLATARAAIVARKTRTFAERFGLLDERSPSIATLAESEDALIDNVRTRNGYMIALAERYPHLGLPRPLIDAGRLAPAIEKPPGKLDLIQQLLRGAKRTPER